MKKWLFILILFPLTGIAQTYQYLGVKDGLSSRRIYCIQKDSMGYMWFLTHEGIDRYDGKDIKQYKLMDGGKEINSLLDLNWLYIDHEGTLWQIGKKGKIFCYDRNRDQFKLVHKIPKNKFHNSSIPITYSWIDKNHRIWLCNEKTILFYNIQTQKVTEIKNEINEPISNIKQFDNTHFFIGTETGIHYAELKNDVLKLLHCDKLEDISMQVNELYYDSRICKLFIGAFQKGILVYDIKKKSITQPECSLTDISISRIKPLNDKEILIATDGSGIYKMNKDTYQTEPYIIADYNSNNAMNGNFINDVYVDNGERIWIANYPIGITVRNKKFANYKWIKHSIGNQQSLSNDQVNSVIEDSDGDLWFGTNNGISLLNSKTGLWKSFLSSFETNQPNSNHIFTTLCEVSPGVIWAGGYSSGIYQLDKKSSNVTYFTPASYFQANHIRPDKYMRNIQKDSQGRIWAGGFYNLKCMDLQTKKVKLYSGLNSITAIIERNDKEMWIGTATGLHLLNKESGRFKLIPLPVESTYIYSLYQAKNGSLYIGTSGSGLLVFDITKKTFDHYNTSNSSLISNNIYSILSDTDKDFLISTENGLASFYPKQKKFHNWTREMGLMATHFNAASATLRSNNNFVFGSANGAVEFKKDIKLPENYSTKMVFSDFKIFYETVYPGNEKSPLQTDINQTKTLRLKYAQNIFSIKVSSINYDYPSNILYSWKLEGFYDQWSKPGTENTIRYTNLAAGDYTLKVRTISHEDSRVIIEERCIDIIVDQPFWLSTWAVLIYIIILLLIAFVALRFYILQKQRKASYDKIEFFINTAHDIRTPLTLIKAPLEELRNKERLGKSIASSIQTALRNVDSLLHLTDNLINFEKTDVYSPELHISEYELNMFMNESLTIFRAYAEIKHINFTYESNFRFLNIWFDKYKMESILGNLISNAVKYTPNNGSIQIFATEQSETWSIEIRDTGIGIPINEQSKLFKFHFRANNAINQNMTGSGIGLILVSKLVHLHKGRIELSSAENQGVLIRLSFPKDSKCYSKAHLATSLNPSQEINTGAILPSMEIDSEDSVLQKNNSKHQRILIVENNEELRNYLTQILSTNYTVQSCGNGTEALTIIQKYKTELIISDIMMPEMRGDQLCLAIKKNIETSHIPVILLTALNNEKDILNGLKAGADEYITKPFSFEILKATVANLLANRELLKIKFTNLMLENKRNKEKFANFSKDVDCVFVNNVKKAIIENLKSPTLTVDILCEMMGMSRTSFYNKLRNLTDQSPADYIRMFRLKLATQLLEEETYSITEIADKTGFNDAKYFREVFKKHFDVCPSQYRKAKEDKEEEEQEEQKEEKKE